MRRLLLGAAFLAGCIVVLPATAQATAGSDWLPLTGTDIKVGCTWNNGCEGGYHGYPAIDFGVPVNRPVYASGVGKVYDLYGGCAPTTPSDCAGKRGNFVQIDHGSHYSRYLHLSRIVVARAQQVAPGQLVGYTGMSGYTTYEHLHYDELSGTTKIDPGALKACHGSTAVAYPATVGANSWSGVPRNTPLRNDGYGCAAALPGEGAFVSVAETGRAYRIAGGAPIYVSTWNAFGGPQPTTRISAADLKRYRSTPKDGTFVRGAPSDEVYRIAGGAPIYVSTWSAFGGSQPSIAIDRWAVDNAGHPESHMRSVPTDGTFVRGAPSNEVYRIAGGAPIYVSTWNAFGGSQPSVAIDRWAVDNSGTPASHMFKHPRDGTFVRAVQSGEVYRVAGGSPIYVSTWDAFGGPQGFTDIDQWAIDNLDSPAAHMTNRVKNRTFVRVANGPNAGLITRAAGGALLGLTSCEPLAGCRGTVNVDNFGFNQYRQRNAQPADGTVLQGLPSGAFWRVEGGYRQRTSSSEAAVGVNDATVETLSTPPASQPSTPSEAPSSTGSTPAPVAPPTSGSPQPPSVVGAFPAKLEVERARVLRRDRMLDVLAPITGRASGELEVQFRAAGRTESFTADIDSDRRRARFKKPIPRSQALLGTGILTLNYAGDDDTQPQEVRLRAASGKAELDAERPVIKDGRVKAKGTISSRARGVVRLQLLYEPPGQTTRTLEFKAKIKDGRYRFDDKLTDAQRQQIAERQGTVHSYTLFTGYFERRIRGEMQSYQVLGAK